MLNTLQDTPRGRMQRHSIGIMPYGFPEPLRTLMLACTSTLPKDRPTSAAVLETLLDVQRQCSLSTQVQVDFALLHVSLYNVVVVVCQDLCVSSLLELHACQDLCVSSLLELRACLPHDVMRETLLCSPCIRLCWRLFLHLRWPPGTCLLKRRAHHPGDHH